VWRSGKPPRNTCCRKPPALGQKAAGSGADLKAQTTGESYAALERFYADEKLLAIVGSRRDTLSDAYSLAMLREYNAGRPILHRPQ
jgi:hypothetical protein